MEDLQWTDSSNAALGVNDIRFFKPPYQIGLILRDMIFTGSSRVADLIVQRHAVNPSPTVALK